MTFEYVTGRNETIVFSFDDGVFCDFVVNGNQCRCSTGELSWNEGPELHNQCSYIEIDCRNVPIENEDGTTFTGPYYRNCGPMEERGEELRYLDIFSWIHLGSYTGCPPMFVTPFYSPERTKVQE